MAKTPIATLALISNSAFSIVNFRGPLIAALVARGVRVFALAPDYDDRMREAVARLGAEPVAISLDRAGMRPLRDLADMVRLARLLRRLRPDAVFGYFVKPVIYGSLAAKAAGVKRRFALVAGLGYVFASNGKERRRRVLLRRLVSRLYAWGFGACDRVFFQNDEDIAHFVEAGLIRRERAYRLNGTGVDLDRLAPAAPVLKPVRFLMMARLLREKGFGEFADAARIVRRVHPEAQFVILGGLDPNPDGLSRDEVERWVEEGVLEWRGHIDDVTPEIAASSVYVLPSYYREGVPRSTQEAMAIGRPVITTDWVGCRETVVDGVTGFLVPVRDAAALAAAMMRFIDEPQLIVTMGRAGRALAEQRFDVNRINEEMLAVMGIAGAPAPAGSAAGEAEAGSGEVAGVRADGAGRDGDAGSGLRNHL